MPAFPRPHGQRVVATLGANRIEGVVVGRKFARHECSATMLIDGAVTEVELSIPAWAITPVLPTEPPVGSVAVVAGKAYARRGRVRTADALHRWLCISPDGQENPWRTWPELHDLGTVEVLFTAEAQ